MLKSLIRQSPLTLAAILLGCLCASPAPSLAGDAKAPAASKLVLPPSSPGKGKMKGWTVYKQAKKHHIDAKKARHIGLDQRTPAHLAVSFAASIVRGDKAYVKLLSPTMPPRLRKLHKTSTFKGLKKVPFNRFFLSATIGQKAAYQGSALAGMARIFGKIFGPYDVLVLIEGPTNRFDHFILAKKIKGTWYVKAFVSKLCPWLDSYAKSVLKPTKR